MRLSGIYLNENNPKDQVIIKYINSSTIKSTQLIKQALYNMAIGQNTNIVISKAPTFEEEIIDDLEGMDFGE